MENYLKNIQSSDEPTKRRYVIVISAVLCLLFFLLWLRYFGSVTTMKDISEADTTVPEGVSFIGSFRAGLADIFHGVESAVGSVASRLASPRSIEVKPN